MHLCEHPGMFQPQWLWISNFSVELSTDSDMQSLVDNAGCRRGRTRESQNIQVRDQEGEKVGVGRREGRSEGDTHSFTSDWRTSADRDQIEKAT